MKKATLKPSIIFQDNMVIQRDKPFVIWGSAPENSTVKISIQGQTTEARVKDEKWSIKLEPLSVSTNETLTLSTREETLILKNICIGEVWLAGGQSNMEFFMRYEQSFSEAIKYAENSEIRFFDYPEVSYEEELDEYDFSKYGFWRTCNPSNLEYFSAVGFYFAQKIQKELNVPVGIIGCNWGGTPACAWMSRKALESNSGKIWLKDYDSAVKNLDIDEYNRKFFANRWNIKNDMFADKVGDRLMFGMELDEMKDFMKSPDYNNSPPLVGPKDPNRPCGLYNTMLLKLAPFAVRGFLWYQGESDDKHPEIYDEVLSSLIQCWRDTWAEELPFLFVQLAPFHKWLDCGAQCYPVLRRMQQKVSETVNNCWMASIMDSGMEFDIHPKNKKIVGERLALLAEGHVYNKTVFCDSPEFESAKKDGAKLELFFANCARGLKVEGKVIDSLEVYDNGMLLKDFTTAVDGNKIVLEGEYFKSAKDLSIKFAEKDYCKVNLFNSANLPAKPFSCTNCQ
ncbi:MAG: sialate O-acetylesterase [Spirochaetales bacterium]|nr:sialate O-acetylesterase [Spirochaetales bacterium]